MRRKKILNRLTSLLASVPMDQKKSLNQFWCPEQQWDSTKSLLANISPPGNGDVCANIRRLPDEALRDISKCLVGWLRTAELQCVTTASAFRLLNAEKLEMESELAGLKSGGASFKDTKKELENRIRLVPKDEKAMQEFLSDRLITPVRKGHKGRGKAALWFYEVVRGAVFGEQAIQYFKKVEVGDDSVIDMRHFRRSRRKVSKPK